MTIHSKVLERRQEVAEDHARQSMGRLLRLLLLAIPLAAVAWVAFSSWLSVSHVEVVGVEVAAVYETLTAQRVVVGTPMILLDPDEVEAVLEMDPWIASATVRLRWPDKVSVTVEERAPLAWVQTRDGWSRRALDGVALPSPVAPDGTLPSIVLAEMGEVDAAKSRILTGALEWIDTLPPRLRGGLVVRVVRDELWADVAGHNVRLGRPVEMAAKAKTLTTLLSEPLPPMAEINLVAPTHPAVSTPKPAEDEAATDDG